MQNGIVKGWRIKRDKVPIARKIIYSTLIAGAICGMVAIWLTKDITAGIVWWFGVYLFSTYILLGAFRCYRIRKFKGHMALRWGFLVFMSAVWVLMIITRGVFGDPWFLTLIYLGLLLFSVQSVRNGYSG